MAQVTKRLAMYEDVETRANSMSYNSSNGELELKSGQNTLAQVIIQSQGGGATGNYDLMCLIYDLYKHDLIDISKYSNMKVIDLTSEEVVNIMRGKYTTGKAYI